MADLNSDDLDKMLTDPVLTLLSNLKQTMEKASITYKEKVTKADNEKEKYIHTGTIIACTGIIALIDDIAIDHMKENYPDATSEGIDKSFKDKGFSNMEF